MYDDFIYMYVYCVAAIAVYLSRNSALIKSASIVSAAWKAILEASNRALLPNGCWIPAYGIKRLPRYLARCDEYERGGGMRSCNFKRLTVNTH